MGYLDGLSAGQFKVDEDGSHIFYPWGILGKGYLLPSADKEHEVHKFLKRYHAVTLPWCLLVGTVADFFGNGLTALAAVLVACIPIFAWYPLAIRKLLMGLQKTSVRLRWSENFRTTAQAYSLLFLWSAQGFSLLMIVFGVVLFYLVFARGCGATVYLAPSFFFMLGIALSVTYAFMIRAHRKP